MHFSGIGAGLFDRAIVSLGRSTVVAQVVIVIEVGLTYGNLVNKLVQIHSGTKCTVQNYQGFPEI